MAALVHVELYLCTIGHWILECEISCQNDESVLSFLLYTWILGRMNCTNLNLTALIFLHFLDALRKK